MIQPNAAGRKPSTQTGAGGGPKKLRSRVADLKQAYKQPPSSLDHKALGVVAVKAPEGGGLW